MSRSPHQSSESGAGDAVVIQLPGSRQPVRRFAGDTSFVSRSGADRSGPMITRRSLLKRSILLGATLAVGGNFVAGSDAAWAMEVEHLSPETMATLVQMARDIYPHDRLADRYYARAVKGYDSAESADDVESGIQSLNKAAAQAGFDNYLAIGWERDRVKALEAIQESGFFEQVRAGLVTGLYNQKEIWPLFGYEGESYLKGGYIDRGFDDIEWV